MLPHQDPEPRINLHEPTEVQGWCQQFGCTEAELCQAVEILGDSPHHVRPYFEAQAGIAWKRLL